MKCEAHPAPKGGIPFQPDTTTGALKPYQQAVNALVKPSYQAGIVTRYRWHEKVSRHFLPFAWFQKPRIGMLRQAFRPYSLTSRRSERRRKFHELRRKCWRTDSDPPQPWAVLKPSHGGVEGQVHAPERLCSGEHLCSSGELFTSDIL